MEITIPKTSAVMTALLKADFMTLHRNRRSAIMALLLPMVIVFSWKSLVATAGGPFVLSNGITLGLVAVGLMGYANALARDREKGVFQRLRVSPAPSWAIMASRLIVQLFMILLITLAVFISGSYFDHISLSVGGYAATVVVAILGGAVFLSLGQAIAGRIKNSETVNSTTRLVYIAFILVGMFGELGVLGKEFKDAVLWTPYGTVKTILAGSMEPSKWDSKTTIALLTTLGYTLIFATLGIKWFKWDVK